MILALQRSYRNTSIVGFFDRVLRYSPTFPQARLDERVRADWTREHPRRGAGPAALFSALRGRRLLPGDARCGPARRHRAGRPLQLPGLRHAADDLERQVD